jgi:hypothetical protein
MTPDQFERLETILNSLEPEIKRMTGKAPEFVRDQIARVTQYGINVRMSPKQTDWLESLYKKFVGSPDALPASTKNDRRDTLDDDEIPF